jgi:hypothetical protein
MTSCRKVKEEKLSQKDIRRMKIGGTHEVRERLFRGGISTGGVTLLPMISKWDKEKYQERNIRSMKTEEASQGEIPFSIDVKGGEKHEERNIGGELVTSGV